MVTIQTIRQTTEKLFDLERQVSLVRAQLDQQEAELNSRKAALINNVEKMLSGDNKYWQCRQPERVLVRLQKFMSGE